MINKKILIHLILLIKKGTIKDILIILFLFKQNKITNISFIIDKLYKYLYSLSIIKLYKIKNYNIYIELNLKKGGLFTLYKGSNIKQRYKNFVLYYDKEKKDYNNYKFYFLKNKIYKKLLLKLAKKKYCKRYKKLYKYYKILTKVLYKRIFV
jgi:hypothetical protein